MAKKSKSYLTSSSGKTLYGNIVILDTSDVCDFADYGGLLYELKKLGICDGGAFQIDNSGDLLMFRGIYKKCTHVLKRFKVRAINL